MNQKSREKNMDSTDYFYELYTRLPRGGPGDNESTRKAFSYVQNLPVKPLLLDIGCGPGMQTIELAKLSHGTIIALDNYQPFLDQLMANAKKEGVQHQIIPKLQSMEKINFEKETFDVIWSEGALYFLGFLKGLNVCFQLLKPHGYLAVTEAVYLKPNPPRSVLDFWEPEYPDIKNIHNTIELINTTDFKILSHFTLPDSSWENDFYRPMEKQIKTLKQKHKGDSTALNVFKSAEKEIEIYRQYSDYFGYEFFIMEKME